MHTGVLCREEAAVDWEAHPVAHAGFVGKQVKDGIPSLQ